jgi:hypothetical protein
MPRMFPPRSSVAVTVSDARAERLLASGWTTGGADVPTKSASKAEWVDYAVSQGMSRDDAESSTKADLVEQYG